MVKNPPTNAGHTSHTGSIPESNREDPGIGNGTDSNILAWKIPWAEEPGGLQFMELQRVGHD